MPPHQLQKATLNRIFTQIENLAVNQDTKSQLVIERDSFDELRKQYVEGA